MILLSDINQSTLDASIDKNTVIGVSCAILLIVIILIYDQYDKHKKGKIEITKYLIGDYISFDWSTYTISRMSSTQVELVDNYGNKRYEKIQRIIGKNSSYNNRVTDALKKIKEAEEAKKFEDELVVPVSPQSKDLKKKLNKLLNQ